MPRRAQQAARCPWCDGALGPRATQCPECRLPLTIAAADAGSQTRPGGGAQGTASTASTSATPFYRVDPQRLPPPARAHRARILAYLLGLTAAILLAAGISSWITVRDPDVRADNLANFDLGLALARAQGSRAQPDRVLVLLDGAEASDSPDHLSVRVDGDLWFAASQSTSGRCYSLASRLTGGSLRLGGPLARGEPCTGDQVRSRTGRRLADAPDP